MAQARLPCTCSRQLAGILSHPRSSSRVFTRSLTATAARHVGAPTSRLAGASGSGEAGCSSSSARRARSRAASREDLRYNYNPNPFDPSPTGSSSSSALQNPAEYPLVTAYDLARHSVPPRKVRMLARDFIDDSLYNPNYGYFPKQAVIFDPDEALHPPESGAAGSDGGAQEGLARRRHGFDFGRIRNMSEWDRQVAETYGVVEQLDSQRSGLGRQVWHTPTELFKPYYAQAVAHHLATEYKLSLYPYNDLVIYEIGAGNGSLMAGVLDFLRVAEPEVYERTRYHIVEISGQLAVLQRARAEKAGHISKVRIVEQSIFDFAPVVAEPCFFLAFEVLDNLAHDVVRYTLDDAQQPLQCVVEVDARGEFSEAFEPVNDPLIRKFLKIRRDVRRHHPPSHSSLHPLLAAHPLLRKMYASLPFAPNLSPPDFLPTKSLALLYKIRAHFPRHRVLMADFDYLPDAVPGRTAPVVQTRYEGTSVACSTYLVSQGWFDIFFPTDFRLLRDMYDKVMQGEEGPDKKGSSSSDSTMSSRARVSDGPWGGTKPLRVLSHRQFLERYGEPECTTLKDGTNPMLELYENAAFIF